MMVTKAWTALLLMMLMMLKMLRMKRMLLMLMTTMAMVKAAPTVRAAADARPHVARLNFDDVGEEEDDGDDDGGGGGCEDDNVISIAHKHIEL